MIANRQSRLSKGNQLPTTFVIFGATGDLAKKKIFPALWHLFKHERLPDCAGVVGFADEEISREAFHTYVADAVKTCDDSVAEKMLQQFLELFTYCAGTFEQKEDFQKLKEGIQTLEQNHGTDTNRALYLAAPPKFYQSIFENLAAADLNTTDTEKGAWTRILIEKPFGRDYESAESLQKLLTTYFSEEQIYRIDHYLFKEIVQGIENFRFSNNLFESQWGNDLIERIDVRLHEAKGVSDRGAFYDTVGALRDVGQNHMLSLLALLTSDYSPRAHPEAIHKNRAALLDTLASWDTESLTEKTFRAQYEGYRNINGVERDSQTETYFAFETALRHPQWKGIPIFFESGKCLAEARKEIVLTLKHPSPCLLCEIGPHAPNKIIFRIEPRDEIVIHFWTKKPGFEKTLEERTLSFFLYEKTNETQYVEEYAKLLNDALMGDRSLFIGHEEVQALWTFVDPIVHAWKEDYVPLAEYSPDTTPHPKLLSGEKTLGGTEQNQRGSIGVVGLGKMGANLARQMHRKGWDVAGFNKDTATTEELASEGALTAASSLKELVVTLSKPRTIWIMVPHQAVESVLEELTPLLEAGDTVIDGGNSYFKDSIRHGNTLEEKGVHFLDAGVSGGPDGALVGVCVMVGGDQDVFHTHEQLFRDIAVVNGYRYVGERGAGHFVKMVHNGIEYGMMQAIAEGFEVLKSAPFSLEMRSVAELYNHGSVISSALIGWLADAYKQFGSDLDARECCSPIVGHSGEGQWTVETARELDIPVSIIEGALEFRKQSDEYQRYAGRVLSALRHEFGGHDARKDAEEK